MVKCVVSGCPNRTANVNRTGGIFNRTPKRFFSFPTDPTRVKESIQVHLKAVKSPIMVLSCEVGSGGAVTSDPTEKGSFFLTLEESRVRAAALPTECATSS